MYQFNYRDRRIAWGPLSGTLAAFRSIPGRLPPSARPFTSLIESLPMYTVPLWGGGRNSAIRFCQGGMSLHAETPLVCFSPRLWLRAVTHEPRMHIESGEAFFTRPRPEKIKTRTIFVGLKAEFLPAIVACGVLDHECALPAAQMALARRLWLFCASKMRTHGLRTHRLPSAC